MTWRPPAPPACAANGCVGCLGMMFRCGHSYSCWRDPDVRSHRCAASWTPVLESLFLAAVVAFVVLYVTGKI